MCKEWVKMQKKDNRGYPKSLVLTYYEEGLYVYSFIFCNCFYKVLEISECNIKITRAWNSTWRMHYPCRKGECLHILSVKNNCRQESSTIVILLMFCCCCCFFFATFIFHNALLMLPLDIPLTQYRHLRSLCLVCITFQVSSFSFSRRINRRTYSFWKTWSTFLSLGDWGLSESTRRWRRLAKMLGMLAISYKNLKLYIDSVCQNKRKGES